jgi:uncharacterized membrane protein
MNSEMNRPNEPEVDREEEREAQEVRPELLEPERGPVAEAPANESEPWTRVEQVDETVPVENAAAEDMRTAEPSPAGRFTESARGQAGVAAGAFRRGEFVSNVAVDTAANSDDRLIALLCYVSQIIVPLILPILVLISESSKKRPFQRFHAVQSLALTSVFVIAALLVSVGLLVIQIIPVIGQIIGFLAVFCLAPIAALMALIALVYYGFQAYQGKRFSIPGLTSFLQDQGWL